MSFTHLIHHGHFGADVAKRLLAETPNCVALPAEPLNTAAALNSAALGDSRVLLAMATPDLPYLERVCQHNPAASVVAAFLFERYLVITPLFGKGQACASCFRRRFQAQPPFPYTVEASEALISLAGIDSGHDCLAYPAMAVRLTLAQCQLQLSERAARCQLIDLAGTVHQSARLQAIHGCSCRQLQGTSLAHRNRFIHFQQELKPWPLHA